MFGEITPRHLRLRSVSRTGLVAFTLLLSLFVCRNRVGNVLTLSSDSRGMSHESGSSLLTSPANLTLIRIPNVEVVMVSPLDLRIENRFDILIKAVYAKFYYESSSQQVPIPAQITRAYEAHLEVWNGAREVQVCG